ncbi:hypothetical protein SAMN05421595_2559 [Austwickia chelonae]|uniref:Uncharacterized protein n=1 Tax=Austwickia chelonae NBRC 105200 TaxID=1184607 RepID=K6UNU1_9MICO|nr:hypothetical protein [Austwickia chelonae]GAB79251.1 hypothetical protein AUCHE_22_00210 [Austwickia chelonae NBRC 105200]SEW37603.1 hypothetical protein SAMN05421595_2559 [Austwickia chelonae]
MKCTALVVTSLLTGGMAVGGVVADPVVSSAPARIAALANAPQVRVLTVQPVGSIPEPERLALKRIVNPVSLPSLEDSDRSSGGGPAYAPRATGEHVDGPAYAPRR